MNPLLPRPGQLWPNLAPATPKNNNEKKPGTPPLHQPDTVSIGGNLGKLPTLFNPTLSTPVGAQALQIFGNTSNANEGAQKITVSYYPQEPQLGKAEKVSFEVSQAYIKGDKLLGASDFLLEQPLSPNKNGNYSYPADSKESGKINALYNASRSRTFIEEKLGRKLSWGFPTTIYSHDKKNGNNAHYSRRNQLPLLNPSSLSFGTYTNKAGKQRHLSQSSETVSHEAGHAVLDRIRPLYMSTAPTTSSDGFHESFADLTAFFTSAADKNVAKMVKEQTGGDLRKPNALSIIGETSGKDVYGSARQGLRMHLNPFKDKPLSELPYFPKQPKNKQEQTFRNQHGEFSREGHNYANIFNGAVYDIFTDVHQQQGKTPQGKEVKFEEKLAQTNKTVSQAFMRGVEYSPLASPTTKELALAMVRADKVENEGQLSSTMEKRFLERNMVTQKDLDGLDSQLAKVREVSDKIPFSPDLMGLNFQKANSWLKEHSPTLNLSEKANYQHFQSFTNDKGDKFVQFVRTIPNAVPHYHYQAPDKEKGIKEAIVASKGAPGKAVAGGVQFIFDKNNQLKDFQVSPLTKQDVKEAQLYAKYNALLAKTPAPKPFPAPPMGIPPGFPFPSKPDPIGPQVPRQDIPFPPSTSGNPLPFPFPQGSPGKTTPFPPLPNLGGFPSPTSKPEQIGPQLPRYGP